MKNRMSAMIFGLALCSTVKANPITFPPAYFDASVGGSQYSGLAPNYQELAP